MEIIQMEKNKKNILSDDKLDSVAGGRAKKGWSTNNPYDWAMPENYAINGVTYQEAELVDCGDEILIRPAGGKQDLIHFLDRETWKETGFVQYPLSYDAARDRIICYADDRSQTELKRIIGYYPRYTAADLLKKAKEVLAGRELSQEDKVRYGID